MASHKKPSLACLECRTKKTKCDRGFPSCGQCIRMKRVCSGPRTQSDSMFVHETPKVAAKVASHASLLESYSLEGPVAPQDLEVRLFQQKSRKWKPMGDLQHVLGHPLGDLGIAWFNRTKGDPKSKFAVQHDYFSQWHQKDTVEINRCIEAVGIAGYVKETLRGDMIYSAERKYSAAVRVVARALSKPDVGQRGELLYAVMMLSAYEMGTWAHESGIQNWVNHVNGMLALAFLATKERQLAESHRLLLPLVLRMVAFQYWWNHKPLPAQFYVVSAFLKTESQHMQEKLHDLVVEMIEFETEVVRGKSDYGKLLLKGLKIDIAVQCFIDQFPPVEHFTGRVEPGRYDDLVYEGVFHVCPVLNTALQRNILRLYLIHLNLMLISLSQTALDSPAAITVSPGIIMPQITASRATILRLAGDICASVPQMADYLDVLNYRAPYFAEALFYRDQPHQPASALVELSPYLLYKPGPFRTSSLPREEEGGRRRPRPDGLYHIYWHLLPLVDIDFLEPSMRKWVKGRLVWIEENAEPADLEKLRRMRKEIQQRLNLGLYRST